jgi:GT2 family glycosyltransferase
MQKILKDTTLVCATLGDEEKLRCLLESIYIGSCIPSYIIIVTYKSIEISALIEIAKHKKIQIKIINSTISAQVYQRNLGIASVTTAFIIQCDDDIRMLFNSIEELHKNITGSHNTVCSPKVIMPNGKSIYQKNHISAILSKAIYFVFNFNWPQNALLMSISGRNYAPVELDISCQNEWLPSCLMYKKEIFKLAITYIDEFGKGYFEDIIFTHSLFLKGLKLKICNSSVFVHPKIESLSYSSLMAVFKKQIVVCKIFNLSIIAAYIDIFLYSFFLLLKKLKRCISI